MGKALSEFNILRGILIASVSSVIMLAAYVFIYVNPSFVKLMTAETEEDAIRMAEHIAGMFERDNIEFKKGALPAYMTAEVKILESDFNLVKLNIMSPRGEVIYSNDPSLSGQNIGEGYFSDALTKGAACTELIEGNADSRPVIVKTCIPVMNKGVFVGAVEFSFDIASKMHGIKRLIFRSNTFLFGMTSVLLFSVAASTYKAHKNLTFRRLAEEKVSRRSDELSALYEVSVAIGRNIDIKELLSEVLEKITDIGIFKVERKGGVFIVEGDKLKLIHHLGHSGVFLDLHKNIVLNDCLCGLAARTGEVVISKNSSNDKRHTITYPEIKPHGHIVVPLKSRNTVVGVLYLYLPADFREDENVIRMLTSLGSQIGTAIENANLYKETKALSLHDPLTGLANRRLLDIEFERSFAKSKRYGNELSAIMIDIDDFKKYNDTYGHKAGDELLVSVSRIVSGGIRATDLASRYGGEEFLILMPQTRISDAHEAAERIRKTIESETSVTVSCGISSFNADMKDMAEITVKADKALYKAKRSGKNIIITA